MAKPKTIVESFMEGLMKDAKGAVDSVTKPDSSSAAYKDILIPQKNPESPQNIGIISGSDQDQNHITKGADKEQISIRSVSDTYQIKRSPKEQDRITTADVDQRITKGSPSASLSKSQTLVFLWFQQRGQSGVFNKPEIGRALSMPYITIRKAISKLETVGVLSLTYDACQKIHEYRIAPQSNLKLSENISNISGSDQDHIRIGSPPLNSSSSLLNKTTTESSTENQIFEIMSTDPEYKYWLDQQVTAKQVNLWKNEFGITLQTVLANLRYVRWQILHQKIEITKSAAHYVYGIMKKTDGTVNKPADYKTMAEMDLDYFEQWKKQRLEKSKQLEQARSDFVKAEIEPKITALIKNPVAENNYLAEAIEKIKSVKTKQAVVGAIKSGKPLDDKSKNILRGYLEEIFTEEAFRSFKEC